MRCLDVVSINQGITTLLQQTGFIPRPYALMPRSPPPSTKPLPQHNLCALTADRQCSISLSTSFLGRRHAVVTFAQETAPLRARWWKTLLGSSFTSGLHPPLDKEMVLLQQPVVRRPRLPLQAPQRHRSRACENNARVKACQQGRFTRG